MRLLLLMLLCSPAVHAMDVEGVHYSRRTLLDESARKHLGCGVAEVAPLSECTVLSGDFDGNGKADKAAIVRRDKRVVIALFPDNADATAPAGVLALTEASTPAAATQAMPGRDCVRLETSDGKGETRSVQWRLLRWDGSAWVVALDFTRGTTRDSARGRFHRESTTSIETGAKLELLTTSHDALDGVELPGSATRSATLLTLKDGVYHKGASAGEETPIPTRVQLARTLEREGLVELALEQAQAAVDKAVREKLADNDARLLDARSLRQRLHARVEAGKAVASR
jgi:hypothetical protein